MVKSSFAFFVYVLHLFVAVSHSGCLYQSDCQSNYVCCSHQCIYVSSCVGRNCSSQSDCASEEVCCGSDCTYGSDCNGSPCNADSDCGQFNLNCCDGTCQYNDCIDAAVFFGSIFGSLVVLFMFLMCISFAFRRRRALDRGRIIVGQRVTTTTTVRSAMQIAHPTPNRIHPPTNKATQTTPLHSMSSIRQTGLSPTTLNQAQQVNNLPLIVEDHRALQGEFTLVNLLMVLCNNYHPCSDMNSCFWCRNR